MKKLLLVLILIVLPLSNLNAQDNNNLFDLSIKLYEKAENRVVLFFNNILNKSAEESLNLNFKSIYKDKGQVYLAFLIMRYRGFTLLELILVIAIIGVLSSIAIIPFSGSNLEPESLAINKIDPHNPFRMAMDEYDALETIFDQTLIYLKKHQCKRAVLVGHNAAFDLNFINAAIKRCSLKNNPFHSFTCFDTATLCGLAYGHTVLAKAVNIAGFAWDPKQAHSAAYDAKKTAEIFCDVVNRYKSIFENITVF